MHNPDFRMDIEQDSLKALEFQSLLQLVSSYARTAPGAAAVLALRPISGQVQVEERLQVLAEALAHLSKEGVLVGGFLPDPGEALKALEVEGRSLETRELLDIAKVLETAGATGNRLAALPQADYPHLREAGLAVPDLREEVAPILESVLPDGSLADDFRFIEAERMLHVLNAPSPAATASLSIGDSLADRACELFGWEKAASTHGVNA